MTNTSRDKIKPNVSTDINTRFSSQYRPVAEKIEIYLKLYFCVFLNNRAWSNNGCYGKQWSRGHGRLSITTINNYVTISVIPFISHNNMMS